MLTKDQPVQGYVIYGEFTRGGHTRQIFFSPDGYTSHGSFVGMKAHYRTVSAEMPRKQWKITTFYASTVSRTLAAAEAGEPYSLDEFSEEGSERRLSPISAYLNDLIARGWQMVGVPLIVEASKQDMDDIAAIKTPTKILYRIKQSRAAAGFPAELF